MYFSWHLQQRLLCWCDLGPATQATEEKEQTSSRSVLQGHVEDDGRQGSTQLASALPQSLGLWHRGDGSLWRVETLLYENWECKLSDGLTRESTADWWENQKGNKVWDELICRFKSLYSVIVQWNREAQSVALQYHCKGRNEQVSHWMDSPGQEKLLLNSSWDKSFPAKGLPSLSLLNHYERN